MPPSDGSTLDGTEGAREDPIAGIERNGQSVVVALAVFLLFVSKGF